MKTFKLHIISFMLSLVIGLLYVYISTPHRRVVVRQPTLKNAGTTVYQDKHDNCFVLEPHKMSCHVNQSQST